jgi:hypothetical protein
MMGKTERQAYLKAVGAVIDVSVPAVDSVH